MEEKSENFFNTRYAVWPFICYLLGDVIKISIKSKKNYFCIFIPEVLKLKSSEFNLYLMSTSEKILAPEHTSNDFPVLSYRGYRNQGSHTDRKNNR